MIARAVGGGQEDARGDSFCGLRDIVQIGKRGGDANGAVVGIFSVRMRRAGGC